MRKVKVKICGLKRAQDIECVNRLLPDYIGFVFAKTKREVTEQQAAQLKAMLNPQIKAVGVFVNAEIDKIVRLAESRTIDVIQLHGDEDAAYCERLRLQTELPIIKAVRVKDAGSFENLQAYPCDYLLFDTYNKGQYGGTGKRFDLALVADEKINKPYFIAGGLEAANVADVLKNSNAFAVDVSGGVETEGLKDPEKIAAFIAEVRGDNNDKRQIWYSRRSIHAGNFDERSSGIRGCL